MMGQEGASGPEESVRAEKRSWECWRSLNKRRVKHNNNLGKMANGTAEEEIAL